MCPITMSIDYGVAESDDHARSVAKWLGYHRVVSGQLHNAQTLANRSLTHVQTTEYVLGFDAPDGSGRHRK